MARDQISTTAAAIKALDGGTFVTLHSRLDRGGALQARKLASGAVQLYWRYSLGGKMSREPIGVYDPSAPPKKLEPTGAHPTPPNGCIRQQRTGTRDPKRLFASSAWLSSKATFGSASTWPTMADHGRSTTCLQSNFVSKASPASYVD
ncbi:hypothetical protein [Variovorax rhizosphaerae]|uniref:Uncharacterized protein n=1 Tax=Variovorax rhizosphaerae TaxID=1836200 RepID=A0ABU8WYB7_9BURK